jgi:hypothetical protein
MSIPGFFAEMSLHKAEQSYMVSKITSPRHAHVIPQMTMQCLVQALGLYGECLAGGYDCRGELEFMIDICKRYT